jgi:hypothetical protein
MNDDCPEGLFIITRLLSAIYPEQAGIDFRERRERR